MKNTYVEFADETLVTFNNVKVDQNGEHVEVYFEKPVANGFNYLQISLPDLNVVRMEGFTKAEVEDLRNFAADNEPLIWELARGGGGPAKPVEGSLQFLRRRSNSAAEIYFSRSVASIDFFLLRI